MFDKKQLWAIRALIVIGVTGALPSSAAATPDLYVLGTSPQARAPGETFQWSYYPRYYRPRGFFGYFDPSSLNTSVGFFFGLNAQAPGGNGQIASSGISVPAADVANITAVQTLTIPQSTAPGVYFLHVFLDYMFAIAETNENNNSVVAQILVGPDLQVASLSVPSVAAAGASIDVANSVTNVGSASTAFSVGFYLSADSQVTTADTLLGTRIVGGLAKGASSSAITAVRLPVGETGARYLGVIVDPAGEVAEAVESDNAAASPLTLETCPCDDASGNCKLASPMTKYCYDGSGNVTARLMAATGDSCFTLSCP